MKDSSKKRPSDKVHDLEVWKYYGSIGGSDKDTMIKIVSWLLGFSTAIIGLYSTGKILVPFAEVLLIFIGFLVSIVAAFVAILYGAYAAWNWSIADRIAESNKWKRQKPDYKPFKVCFPLSLAKPSQDKIARVFWIFFAVSMASACVHIALLLYVTCWIPVDVGMTNLRF